MTHRLDLACSRELSARWCALAERRLDHLTDLFESGRWRRYHSEYSLLENIREAKIAVKTWRALSLGETVSRSAEINHGAEISRRVDTGVAAAPRVAFVDAPIQQAFVAHEPAPQELVQQDADPAETIEYPAAFEPSIETVMAESDSDIMLPEDIVLYQLVPSGPRVDMAALEQALSVGMETDDSEPLMDIDAIERRYPALRHAL